MKTRSYWQPAKSQIEYLLLSWIKVFKRLDFGDNSLIGSSVLLLCTTLLSHCSLVFGMHKDYRCVLEGRHAFSIESQKSLLDSYLFLYFCGETVFVVIPKQMQQIFIGNLGRIEVNMNDFCVIASGKKTREKVRTVFWIFSFQCKFLR